jgi:hypothetical protein
MEKTVRFYSKEEQKELLKIVNDRTINVRAAALEFSKKYNRNIGAVEVKIYKTRRTLDGIKKQSRVVKATPIVEQQQAADIGVEVPHGMTFEGTPKKIMLHSDHFRIYF